MVTADLLQHAQDIAPRITALRRAIHQEPELGLDTPLTLAKVRAELADLPLEWHTGPSCTGAVAVLKGGAGSDSSRPSVLLRGDMDALPMQEETGLAFSSQFAGKMHACGHDTHTAMLAGAARILCGMQDQLAGDVRFMFQPGEEGYHGALKMLEDGLLDPLPDAAFALHIMPNSRHGVLASRAGAMMAAADQIEITVTGRGGHASLPHQTRDPVPVACEIVTAIQSLVTRRFSAAEACIVTITQMNAGSAHNVIADKLDLRGTIRTLSAARRTELRAALVQLASAIAQAHECSAAVHFNDGFPVTVNDARAVALARSVAQSLPGGEFEELAHPLMGAEDFSYVLEKVPGMMAFLGVAEEGSDWSACCGIHSTRMLVDERVLPRGAAFLAGCAAQFLADGGFAEGQNPSLKG